MPIFNSRKKAGSGEGQQVHIGHMDPFSAQNPLTAHLNRFDKMTVERGGKSTKPAGGFGTDPGATFHKGQSKKIKQSSKADRKVADKPGQYRPDSFA